MGHYSVEIARYVGGLWTPTVPPLYATLTDQRLILQPQTRRRYEPAIIPGRAISSLSRIEQTYAGRHQRGVVLYLPQGITISLLAAGKQGATFIEALQALHTTRHHSLRPAYPLLAAVAPCPVRFDNRVELDRLRRLIARVETL